MLTASLRWNEGHLDYALAALALTVVAVPVAFVRLAGAAIDVTNLANLELRVPPRTLVLLTPLLAGRSLATALLAALVYRRL